MSTLVRTPNGNLEITLVFPWPQVQSGYESQILKELEEVEIPGFRKGKAPRHLAEPKLNKSHVYGHVLEQLLPDAYAKAVQEHSLHPILQPQIRIVKTEDNQDWEVLAITCEIPEVKLSDYKSEVKTLKPPKEDEKLSTIVEHLRKSSVVKIPDLLVEEEANHRLSALIDNLTKLGMTTENYLKAKKLDPEGLKSQTAAEARIDLEVEFILETIRKDNDLKDRKSTLDFLVTLL